MLTDTNILLRARDSQSAAHEACREALHRLNVRSESVYICAQVYIEYWSVATRPLSVNGLGLEPADVERELRVFDGMFVYLSEPPDLLDRWRALVSQHQVRGRQVHDARLVAVMDAHGIDTLLTLNTADFARYAHITCVSPDAV